MFTLSALLARCSYPIWVSSGNRLAPISASHRVLDLVVHRPICSSFPGTLAICHLFPQQIRASAIAVFYGLGTLFAGVLGPAVFGALLNRGDRLPIFWGFTVSASVGVFAGAAQAIWGVSAERKSLEDLA
jgi:hypothetical protein